MRVIILIPRMVSPFSWNLLITLPERFLATQSGFSRMSVVSFAMRNGLASWGGGCKE